jgi:hypothetical protein
MKNLLLIIAAVMLFSTAGNAQKNNLSGTWNVVGGAGSMRIVEKGGFISFTEGTTSIGAGYKVSQSKAVLVQTMTGDGCSVDMYVIFDILSRNKLNMTYEFLEDRCGWKKGTGQSEVLTRK